MYCLNFYKLFFKFYKYSLVLYLPDARVRLITLELAMKLLKQLIKFGGQNILLDRHLTAIETAKEQSTLLLRNFYKVTQTDERQT